MTNHWEQHKGGETMKYVHNLLCNLAVWYVKRDALRYRYNPSDHFWCSPWSD